MTTTSVSRFATKTAWIAGILFLGGCVGSPSPQSGDHSGRRKPPARIEAGISDVPIQPTEQTEVDVLAKRLEETEKNHRIATADMERRYTLLEQELGALRGDLDLTRHQGQQLQERLAVEASRPSARPTERPVETKEAPVSDSDSQDPDNIDAAEPASAPAEAPAAPTTVPSQRQKPELREAPAPPQPAKEAPAQQPQSKSAKQAYDNAFLLLKGGKYQQSLAAFRSFLQTFKGHPLSDNAQYWIGELHYVQRQFPEALVAFNQVLVNWPSSTKIPACLLKIGYSFHELSDLANARASLKRLINDYPTSPAVPMAEQRLKLIDKKESSDN